MKPTLSRGSVPVVSFDDRKSIIETNLPSLGIPYRSAEFDPFPAGSVRISAMTVAEEKVMAQKGTDPNRKITNLIGKVCDLRGMKPEQLLVADQFYLLMKIRSLSYGSDYSFKFHCEHCSHQWKHSINLETDLNVSVVDDEWVEPFELQLLSGNVITYRLLRSIDEIELNNRRIKKGDSEDPSFVSLLARCILSIDGTTVISPMVTEAWIEKMSVRDRALFTKHIESNTPGYSGDLEIQCPSCEHVHEAGLPMTADFFRPDVSI